MKALSLINRLFDELPQLKGIIVAGEDGLPIIEKTRNGLDSEEISAQLLAVINNVTSLGLGKVEELSFTVEEGNIFTCRKSPDGYFIIAVAGKEVIPGKLRFYMELLSRQIKL